MEKSNLPLPLKRKTIREAISGVRDDPNRDTRTTVQFKHSLVRDGSSRVTRERPQFGGCYLKKRFGYNCKKTGVAFSRKGSKAVVTSLCSIGDFADACFPSSGENAGTAEESIHAKRGALSMKSKLLQLQERNRLILAKHQFPRTSSTHTEVDPNFTSCAISMSPLTLKIETTDEEVNECNEQARLGEFSNTSPIYHELDPIDGYSLPEQHTYQSISEVREEMARLQAQRDFGYTLFACQRNPENMSLKTSEPLAQEPQKKASESSIVQESEPKQNRLKRSIFSKFWLSRRNLLSAQEVGATSGEKAVLTGITPLADDETRATQTGDGLRHHPSGMESSPVVQPSSFYLLNSPTHPKSTTASSIWNSYNKHSFVTTDSGNNDYFHRFCIPSHSSYYCNAGGNYSNRDGTGNSHECFYSWKSDDNVESESKVESPIQKILQSFGKRTAIKPGMQMQPKPSEEYFSSTEMAEALTEYHWNAYQTGIVEKNAAVATTTSSSRRADHFLEASRKDTRAFLAFHQDQTATSHFLPVQVAPYQTNAETVLAMGLNTSDIYSNNTDTGFLHSQPATSSLVVRGKMSHSQFSSPSCGVRMAEMRAVRRKSESGLLSESPANTAPHSPIPRHSKSTGSCTDNKEILQNAITEPSPCTKSDIPSVWRSIHTILEEDQLPDNVSSRHLAVLSGSSRTDCKARLSKKTESSLTEPTLSPSIAASNSLKTNEECKIPEEIFSSDEVINDHETTSIDLTNVALQTKRSTDRKTNGSKLKQPKPIKHCTASRHTKTTNYTRDNSSSMLNLPAEQYMSSPRDRKTENASPNTSLLLHNSRTVEREPTPLVRQAIVRQIESVSAVTDTGLGRSESPSFQRTLQRTPRQKSGSCIPRTKHSSANRIGSADDKPARNICLRETEVSRKRVDYRMQKKQLSYRSQDEGIGLVSFRRNCSEDVTFQHSDVEPSDCLCSQELVSSTEMSNRCEASCADQTPLVLVDCPDNLEYHDHEQNTQWSSSGEYQLSAISSLSSSLTSSNSSSSVFGVTDSDTNSPTSSSTRDLTVESESPTSSIASRTDVQPSSSLTIPGQDSGSKHVESTGTKPQRGKSQLQAPRTDANRCLERLERLRIESKQTKSEFQQKLRH